VRIYYINLDRRSDRRDWMEALAGARGLELTRIAAVDASSPDFAMQVRDMKRKGPTGEMSNNTLACTLSHFKAWKTFVDDPAAGDLAVVLEDDVNLAPAVAQALAVLATADLGEFGLIKLELFDTMTKGAVVGRPRTIGEGFNLRRSFQIMAGSAAYIVTRDLARRFLQYRSTIRAPVDHFLFYPRAIPGFWGGPYGVLDPPVACQHAELVSDISAARMVGSTRRRAWDRFRYEAAQAPSILRELAMGKAQVVKFDGSKILKVD